MHGLAISLKSCLAASGAALLLFLLPGCYREATDTPNHPRHDGSAPLAIDGVRPGMTRAEIKAILGESLDQVGPVDKPLVRWGKPKESTVIFDSAGRATEVSGSAVTAGDRSLVWIGAGEADVIQILGKPGSVLKSTRPKGGGVISTGRELVGKSLVYRQAGVRFEIFITEDMVRSFRATIDLP